ncbi:MAG: DUF4358 domain-containing protein [Clostridia bacterium]|nr:DUF4358 domain-containing protein [Clostridia bacterium]
MKKFTAILMAALMLISFASCTKSPTNTNVNVDLDAIKAELIEETGVTEPIEIGREEFYSLYGIEADKVKHSASYLVSTEIFPDEIMMVEASDDDAAKLIAEKLQLHLEDLKSQATDYDAKGLAIAEATQVHINGRYVAMFFSQQRETMEEIYLSHFE